MKVIKLRGLAEGLIGKSTISAKNFNEALSKFPILNSVKEKLSFKKNTISGFSPCDG